MQNISSKTREFSRHISVSVSFSHVSLPFILSKAVYGDTNDAMSSVYATIAVQLLFISSESDSLMNITERYCIVAGHLRLLYGSLVKPVIVISYCSVAADL